MVPTNREVILVLPERGRVQGIKAGIARERGCGEGLLGELYHSGIDQVGWDLVVWKRVTNKASRLIRVLPRTERVENLLRNVAEIAPEIGLGRHSEEAIGGTAIAKPFIAEKEETLVAAVIDLRNVDRSPHGCSKHVLAKWCFLLEKGISSIESIVT